MLITDGISLRNFAYSSFHSEAKKKGFKVTYWHCTPFDLETLGFQQKLIENPKLHWLSEILKSAKKRIELNQFCKRNNDNIFKTYAFPLKYKGFKNTVKSIIIKATSFCFNSESGLKYIRKTINKLESKTAYYNYAKNLLLSDQPDLVYCTSQRSSLAIAPLLATKELNIPTVSFIYSWDNLPKATLDVSADYYHVWSNHMYNELKTYYPFVDKNRIKITGTPQFEPHYSHENSLEKESFYKKYNLDINKTYFCYSGDDVTTSPKDELYLRDIAMAIRNLNASGQKLGLIFRRCPVDFSDRYDNVINEFKDVIVPIEPIWEKVDRSWNAILPLKEDLFLLRDLVKFTSAVINLGSSMVFDYIIHQKPCLYMNYNYLNDNQQLDKGVYVYDYVHFRSMPSNNAVYWLNSPNDIKDVLLRSLDKAESISVLQQAEKWFITINQAPPELASSRICNSINNILSAND